MDKKKEKKKKTNNMNWIPIGTTQTTSFLSKLTTGSQHHPKADIDRIYVPRKDGGRGLMQIEGAYIT
jgi:hypothetical protein